MKRRGRRPGALDAGTERLINVLSLAAPGIITYRLLQKGFGKKHKTICRYVNNARKKGFVIESFKHVGYRIKNPRIISK